MARELPRLEDAVVQEVRIQEDRLEVRVLDWREAPLVLVFEEALACRAFAPVGEDLAELRVLRDAPLLAEVRSADPDAPADLGWFGLLGAWDGRACLEVAARALVWRAADGESVRVTP